MSQRTLSKVDLLFMMWNSCQPLMLFIMFRISKMVFQTETP